MAFVAIAAAAISAYAAYSQSKAQEEAADANAKISRENAAIALQQGQAASNAQEVEASRRMGAMIAAYGASGVQVDTGSPVEVLGDSARMATLDNLNLKYNYQLRAKGFNDQAGLDDMAARNYSTAAVLNGASSAMRSYASYSSTYGSSLGGSTSINGPSSSMFMNKSVGSNGM